MDNRDDDWSDDLYGYFDDDDDEQRRIRLTNKLTVAMRWDGVYDLMFLAGLDGEYKEMEKRLKAALKNEFGVEVHRIEWKD